MKLPCLMTGEVDGRADIIPDGLAALSYWP